MDGEPSSPTQEALTAIYRQESSRVLATLVRLLGDFDIAEDAMLAAYTAALEQWPKHGIPNNPRAWLISTGRFKAIDAIRRETRLFSALSEVAKTAGMESALFEPFDESEIEDDRLRLIFACCHPALAPDARVALMLREVCGLTTEEIAKAYLSTVPTVAQRIVRAKGKIRELGLKFELPDRDEWTSRTSSVLQVIYLLYNEGYYASSGEELTRSSLSEEAIRLGRLLVELLAMPQLRPNTEPEPKPEPEPLGLLSLMLLQESRRASRVSSTGDLVLLADQDQSLWNHTFIQEGLELCSIALASPSSLKSRGPGPYALQAGIAAAHIKGALNGQTDWDTIIQLYDQLLDIHPSAVVALNRAVAVMMRDGPEIGLQALEKAGSGGELDRYGFAYSARADFLRRLGRMDEAATQYRLAIELSEQAAEKRFLESRLREVTIP